MNFDRIAPFYQLIESATAGSLPHRCRLTHFGFLKGCSNALLLGEGNGRFLIELTKQFPEMQLTVVDSSQRMLDLARKRLQKHNISEQNVTWVNKDVREWEGEGQQFDAIVANFFFDCFRPLDLQRVIHGVARLAGPQAVWLIADFQHPRPLLRRIRAEVLLAAMYVFFRKATKLNARTLTDPDEYLEDSGFELRERRTYDWGLLRADVWQHTDMARSRAH